MKEKKGIAIRGMPREVWHAFNVKRVEDGWSLNALLHQLIYDYISGYFVPSVPPSEVDASMRER